MAGDSFRKEEDGMEQGVQNPLGVGIIGTGFGLMHRLGYQACDNGQIFALCQRTPVKDAVFA